MRSHISNIRRHIFSRLFIASGYNDLLVIYFGKIYMLFTLRLYVKACDRSLSFSDVMKRHRVEVVYCFSRLQIMGFSVNLIFEMILPQNGSGSSIYAFRSS